MNIMCEQLKMLSGESNEFRHPVKPTPTRQFRFAVVKLGIID